jgi:hemoglobin
MFEFAGGGPAFLALAAALHERCLQDPELNHPFSQTQNPQHVENLAAYWAEVFGGPSRYSAAHGGHSAMISIHAGQGAGDDYGPRFVACFMQAVDDAHLPDDPDFRKSLRSYIVWATRDVLSYSPPGAKVQAGMSVPSWSWNRTE